MNNPIYEPKGEAAEYAKYALNIYRGCNHGCVYCYAPAITRKKREDFFNISERMGLLNALRRQLCNGDYSGELIHLCFTCDPYPKDIDTSITREVIRAIKEYGGNVQILTKGGMRAERDFDLLDANDWFGVTLTSYEDNRKIMEPNTASNISRLMALKSAKSKGIKTWVSLEPIIDPLAAANWIMNLRYVDKFAIGKMNHMDSDLDWKAVGLNLQNICEQFNRNYMIKSSLKREMYRVEKND